MTPIQLPDGKTVDLDYFVEWRAWLWRPAVRAALDYLGDLRGRTVLEVGGRHGRMSCLMAMLGAKVTMLDRDKRSTARDEVRKWGLGDRIELHQTDGTFAVIEGRQFDVIFTKSVLWSVAELDGLLAALARHLAPGGRVAFVENYRGGMTLDLLRRLRPGGCRHMRHYHGIRSDQLVVFRHHFEDVTIRRHRLLAYSILGCHREQLREHDGGAGSADQPMAHDR